MDNYCIICRKAIPEVSIEHVFPESIGGVFSIKSVCKKCNSILGQSVDIKLIDHIVVKIFRERYQIPGKSGSIPSFFNQTVIMDNDPCKEARLKKVDNGDFDLRHLPNTKSYKTESGENKIELSIDHKDFDKLKDMKEKVIQRLTKVGKSVDFSEPVITTIKQPQITGELPPIDHTKFKIGFLKIAYEFACEMIPFYLKDDWSLQIAEILKNANISYINKFVFGNGFDIERISFLQEIGDFTDNHTIHLFDNDCGLICYVSIFSEMCILVRLSEKCYCNGEKYMCYNNYRNKSFSIKKFSEIDFE